MGVEFDPGTTSLSLERVDFTALCALDKGAHPPAKGLDRLRAAGVVTGSTIHPTIRPAMKTVADPVAVARLEMLSDDSAQVVAECWIGTTSATYLVGPVGERLKLITTGAAFFPISIARLVGLSPRRRATFQPWRVPVEMADQIFGEDRNGRAVVRKSIDEGTDDRHTHAYAAALERGPWWYWNLAVHWPDAAGADKTRTLHVVDTQEGMSMMSLSEERVAFDPTGPTEVFGLLASILLRDERLTAASDA